MDQLEGGDDVTDEEYRISRYDGAVRLLPCSMRERARALPRRDRERAEEIRLRNGRPPSVLMMDGEVSLGGDSVTERELEMLVEAATGASLHSAREQLKAGYILSPGGYRIGLCGSVFLLDGRVGGYGSFSSAAIRISREHRGIARELMAGLTRGGVFRSALIIAPPGAGKTTLLRDVTASLSDGAGGIPGMRVALADERGEVAAMTKGTPQMYVGRRTDVLDGCPKAEAVMLLLRSMNPQVIALDEITSPEDIKAVTSARNCGVALLATAHAEGIADLRERPSYRALFDERVFGSFVTIKNEAGRRVYELIRGEDL